MIETIMTGIKTRVIVNPISGGGKTAREIERITGMLDSALGASYSLSMTNRPGYAESLTKKAIREGARLVIGVGGDGTMQEIVNGFMQLKDTEDCECELGIISSGTGQGLAQSLDLPASLKGQLDMIGDTDCREIDIGKVRFCDASARTVERYFVNECQIGIGGEVVRRMSPRMKMLGGRLAFGVTAFVKALSYPGRLMTLVIDDSHAIARRLIGVAVANGAYTGGGMFIAPGAAVNDGLLDVLLIENQSCLRRLWNFPRIYTGNHIRSKEFSYFRCRKIEVNCNDRVPLEADGESLGFLPCTINVIPQAIRIKSNGLGRGERCDLI